MAMLFQDRETEYLVFAAGILATLPYSIDDEPVQVCRRIKGMLIVQRGDSPPPDCLKCRFLSIAIRYPLCARSF